MSSYVSAELRRHVRRRAEGLCEYCMIHEDDTGFGCEIDHISEKHGGQTVEDNLALACWICNNSKGTDIASIDPRTRGIVRLFNPRTDRWSEHFRVEGSEILSLTPIGEVTARILGFNLSDQIDERALLIGKGRFPSPAALHRIRA